MNELMIKNIAHTVGSLKGTMSSLEIAKLVGKEHFHIMRDIREFLEEIEIEGGESKFGSTYFDAQGKERPMYVLPKRECLGMATKYDAKLRMNIIDRWAELEHKELTNSTLSPRMQAITTWQDETNIINDVLTKLGYSQGYLRKEALEIGFRIESETGYAFMPKTLTNDPEATNPEPLSERTGTHAAYVGIGTHGSTPSSIAQSFGKDISPTDINNILVTNGYQTRFASGKYKPTEKGTILCNQSTLASGKYRGNVIVKEWLFNSNKAFRDDIAQAVIGLRKRRSNNLINSKAHIRCV